MKRLVLSAVILAAMAAVSCAVQLGGSGVGGEAIPTYLQLNLLEIPQGSVPDPSNDKLYNIGGALYWNTTNISAGGGGISTAEADTRYLKLSGGTMTGTLAADAGLVLETRTDDPSNPQTGRIWFRSDI